MHRALNRDAAPRTTEQGQTLAEYVVVLGVITVTVVLAIFLLSESAGGGISAAAEWFA